MTLIEVTEKLNSLGAQLNETECLEVIHGDFEGSLKGLKELKEKNLEDENLKKLSQNLLLFYGIDIFNVPEDVLRETEEELEGLTEEEKIKLFLEALENEKIKVYLKNLFED